MSGLALGLRTTLAASTFPLRQAKAASKKKVTARILAVDNQQDKTMNKTSKPGSNETAKRQSFFFFQAFSLSRVCYVQHCKYNKHHDERNGMGN